MPQGRYFRPKDKSLIGTKWDSKLEETIGSMLQSLTMSNGAKSRRLLEWAFHRDSIKYTISKTYQTDFTLTGEDGKLVYLEAKGYFQDSTEAAKYVWVREVLGPNEEIVFIFENPETKLHYLAKRKNGTKMTMREWAEKNKFRWYTVDTIEELIEEMSVE